MSASNKRPLPDSDSAPAAKKAKFSPEFVAARLMGPKRNEKMFKILTKLTAIDWRPLQSFSQQRIAEFVRFLALKSFFHDVDADKLSPGPSIDEVWHAAILDTRFYETICNALGHALHHRPEGEHETDKKQREDLMNMVFKFMFATEADADVVEVVRVPPAYSAPVSSAYVTLTVKANQKSLLFSVSLDSTVLDLKTRCSVVNAIPVDMQRLVFEGKQLYDAATMRELGVVEGSEIHSILMLRGC